MMIKTCMWVFALFGDMECVIAGLRYGTCVPVQHGGGMYIIGVVSFLVGSCRDRVRWHDSLLERACVKLIMCVCQRVNQEACGVVKTMWTQDAKLTWDKLKEQFYTVEKRQEINLGSKFMP
ncbi:unnamed protein product [Brassica rapa]|uniref:Retrotransposon gag domain-containing protein n=1 Tax=Brassica campestris TaxID=3711 RepID=A0A3P5ZI43_BRACM|nr:unnamed protein product [Brassica rapa]VDC76005.1 unnamed protein product [Brassica rapa]